MGLLIDGQWHDRWYDTQATGGRFVRTETSYHHGIDPQGPFPPAAGRYHLYVAAACPWAHRTTIFRALKGLDALIGVSVVEPDMLDQGWTFSEAQPDHLHGAAFLHQVYTRADPQFTGRVTVPILWDTQTDTIVNNESSEIIRYLDAAFHDLADPRAPLYGVSMYPEALRADIDAINATVYDHVNNGVYKAGFATTQEAYDEAVTALFETLDMLEARLASQPWLVGHTLTEADWRLFTTLLRFDLVYHVHFKCSRRRIVDYPNLWDHTRALYQVPGVADTVDVAAIRRHYFYSHASVNPHRIVPILPDLDLTEPAGRTAALPERCRAGWA